MAIVSLSRNVHRFRNISRHLCSQSLSQWRSTIGTSQLCDSFSGVSNANSMDHHHFRSSLSAIGLGRDISSLGMYHRHFWTKTATGTVPTPKSESTGENSEPNNGESGQSGEQGRPKSPISWLSFVLLVLTAAGLIFFYNDQKMKRHREVINKSNDASVGPAAIGGPFSLVNHEGKRVTEKDFLGKWTLIYFGFTHCPDICPDELQKLAAAVDKIKDKASIEIVPVFISVDPERDTVEQLGEYVAEFHPKLIGLTGTKEEVRKVAKAYRLYYMKAVDPEWDRDDYLIDHSVIMYLMSPSMDYVNFFGKDYTVDELADGVVKEIKQYKEK